MNRHTPSRLDIVTARELRGCSGVAKLARLGSPIVLCAERLRSRRFARRHGGGWRRMERIVYGTARGTLAR